MPLPAWSVEGNSASCVRDPKEIDANEDLCEVSATGTFTPDYMRMCEVLRIAPHPCLQPPPESAPEIGEDGEPIPVEPVEPSNIVAISGSVCDIGTMIAMSICIPVCSHVTTIKLWHAGLDLEAIELLVKILEDSNVQKLYLEYNPIAEDGIGEKEKLVTEEKTEANRSRPGSRTGSRPGSKKGSRPNTASKKGVADDEDDLATYDMGKLSVWCKFVTLSGGSNLQFLSLRGNEIGDVAGSQIFYKMRENKHLMSLNMWGNKLGDNSMKSAEQMVLINKSLQYFSVGNNLIGDKGVTTLLGSLQAPQLEDREDAKRLKKYNINCTATKTRTFRDPNCTLRILNVGHNQNITDEGSMEVLYTVNPAQRPWKEEVVDVVLDKKGKPMKAPPPAAREFGKENKLEQLICYHNGFSLDTHVMLKAEERIVVQDLQEDAIEGDGEGGEEKDEREAEEEGEGNSKEDGEETQREDKESS